MVDAAQMSLEKISCQKKVELEILGENNPKCALSPGCGIVLTAALSSGSILGTDELGKIGKPAEEVGRVAADNLIDMIQKGAPVDEHLADQLLVYMALAKGRSKICVAKISTHIESCIYVCEKFLGPIFTVTNKEGCVVTISCDGVGFSVP